MAINVAARAERSHGNREGSLIRRAAATLGLLLLTSSTAFGQGSTTATIRGTIQDPTGSVVPGASVTIVNVGTRTPTTAVSDDRGQYFLAGLFPGTYDLKVE